MTIQMVSILLTVGLNLFSAPLFSEYSEEGRGVPREEQVQPVKTREIPTVANLKQTKTEIQSGFQGTAPWSLDSDGTLTFGGGTLVESYSSGGTIYQIVGSANRNKIKRIVFTAPIKAHPRQSSFFASLSNLEAIHGLEFWDTSQTLNMSDMFAGDASLTSLDLSNFETQNVTDMEDMFAMLLSLTSLDVSSFDTQNVTNMSGMFYGVNSLTSLDLSNFETQNVTDMSYMFGAPSVIFGAAPPQLTSLDVSSFDTQNVTDMSYMFHNASSLTTLDLSSFDIRKVTDMREMFSGASSLTTLDISSWDVSKRIILSAYMFMKTSSLQKIKLGKKTKFMEETEGYYYFLPNPPNNTTYTGRWVSSDGPFVSYNRSYTLLLNGTNEDKQTFIWERTTAQTFTPTLTHLYIKENDFQSSVFAQDQQLLKNLIIQSSVERVNYQPKDAGTGLVVLNQDYTPSKSADPLDRLFDVTFPDGLYTEQKAGKEYRVQLTLLASKANPTLDPSTGPTVDYSFETKVLLLPEKQGFTQSADALDFEEKAISGAESSTGFLSLTAGVGFQLTDLKNTYDTSKGLQSEASVNTATGVEKIHLGKIQDLTEVKPLTNQEVVDTWKVNVELKQPFTNANNVALDANVVFHKANISKVGTSNTKAEIPIHKTVTSGAGTVNLLDGTAGGGYQFQKGEHQVLFDKADIQLEIVNEVPQFGIYQTTLFYILEASPNA